MRTPKIEALHRLITWYNNRYNTTIPLLGVDLEPISNNSWLSGFIEADGSFYLNYKFNKNDMLIGIVYYLRISQKQTYTRKIDSNINVSNLPHMEQIGELLNTKVTNIVRHKQNYVEKAFEVRTDKLVSKLQLFDYLNKFPLFGYKYYSHINLEKIHKLVINKEYKTIEGKNKILDYKSLMKYNEQYTWEHIQNFYLK